jgi:hypothetical protein
VFFVINVNLNVAGISQNMDNMREYTRNKSVESEDNDVAA